MIIEQDQEQLHNAIALHTKAEISSVRLAWARSWSRPMMPNILPPSSPFNIAYKVGDFHLGAGHLTLETDFNLVVFEAGKEQEYSSSEPMIRIDCRFEAQYSLAPEYIPTEREIEAFRSANAIFNCWPYFREYIQGTTIKMGLPALVIPFLRIVVKKTDQPAIPQQIEAPSVATKQVRRRRRLRD